MFPAFWYPQFCVACMPYTLGQAEHADLSKQDGCKLHLDNQTNEAQGAMQQQGILPLLKSRELHLPAMQRCCSCNGSCAWMTASTLTTMSVQTPTPALASMQSTADFQAGTAASAQSAGSTEAAHWCGASVHMLPQTGAAFAGTSAASPTQRSSRAMPVAEIAELGDGTTTLVPSGQARLSLSERQVRMMTCTASTLQASGCKPHVGAQSLPLGNQHMDQQEV